MKRAIYDANTQEGVDNILFTFAFPEHKIMAMRILQTIMPRNDLVIAAGGHQGYSALGGLYTSAKPNNLHIYGDKYEQVKHLPNHRQPTQETDQKSGLLFDTNTTTIYNKNDSNLLDIRNTYVESNSYLKRADYLDPNKVNSAYDPKAV